MLVENILYFFQKYNSIYLGIFNHLGKNIYAIMLLLNLQKITVHFLILSQNIFRYNHYYKH